jgi:hypothetical protein
MAQMRRAVLRWVGVGGLTLLGVACSGDDETGSSASEGGAGGAPGRRREVARQVAEAPRVARLATERLRAVALPVQALLPPAARSAMQEQRELPNLRVEVRPAVAVRSEVQAAPRVQRRAVAAAWSADLLAWAREVRPGQHSCSPTRSPITG